MTGPVATTYSRAGIPGGTDACVEGRCTCPPEQLGPTFAGSADCPLRCLHALELLDVSGWVTIRSYDGLEARAATAEAAGRMIDRMRARGAD